MKTCSIPKCYSVADGCCTNEVGWHLCEKHMIVAAANDFRPRYYGKDTVLDPQWAVTVIKARRSQWTPSK